MEQGQRTEKQSLALVRPSLNGQDFTEDTLESYQ